MCHRVKSNIMKYSGVNGMIFLSLKLVERDPTVTDEVFVI